MDKNMHDRLVASDKRLKEIDELLLLPETSGDMREFKKLSKERSVLEPIVEKFNEWEYANTNKNDALLMCGDTDPDIAQMGKEELKKNEQLLETIEEELRILLIPKDPNDGKDIIFEIKGAVGGDEANIFAGDLLECILDTVKQKVGKLKSLMNHLQELEDILIYNSSLVEMMLIQD